MLYMRRRRKNHQAQNINLVCEKDRTVDEKTIFNERENIFLLVFVFLAYVRASMCFISSTKYQWHAHMFVSLTNFIGKKKLTSTSNISATATYFKFKINIWG
jgi:hypothetical protein